MQTRQVGRRPHLTGLIKWHRMLSGAGSVMPEPGRDQDRLRARLRVAEDAWPALRAEISSDCTRRGSWSEDRAAFRRADSVGDVLMMPGFARFLSFVWPGETSEGREHICAAARAALACARVEQCDLSASLGDQFGRSARNSEGKPVLSMPRATALLQQADPDEALRLLTQSMMIVGKANILDVFAVAYDWAHPNAAQVDSPRAKLARDYFARTVIAQADAAKAA